jgi:hypothetical protein
MDRLTGVSQLSVIEICAPRCLAVRRVADTCVAARRSN